MRPHLTPQGLRGPLAAALVCALLLTQALGWLHRAVHAHEPHLGAVAHAAERPAGGLLSGLFAHHDDAADCQAFDQLSHADAAAASVIEADPLRMAGPMVLGRPGSVVAVQAAGYLARGPPGAA